MAQFLGQPQDALMVTKQGGKVTLFSGVRKADTQMVVQDVLTVEDEFSSLYFSDKNSGAALLEPPFNPALLKVLVTRNNILAQCVEAMEVNIDGTGHTLEPVDITKESNDDSPEKKKLESFFREPFPMWGFIELRRNLRSDLETTGNGYMEVLRNLNGEIVFLRWLDAKMLRLVKLDAAVEVPVELEREGQKVKAKIWTRERRFAQMVGTKVIYFKEFGASRELDRDTGQWAEAGQKVQPDKRASEIIHFTVKKDAKTPYGIPRWINQLPSVLGSRKAEEFNLEFFDSGGIPPAAIFIQGGALAEDVIEQLRSYFSPNNRQPSRVAVIEVQSTSGTIDAPGSVQVKVERFGDSKTNDAMFQSYDKACEEHVRVAFRLPPIFLGKAADFNFATAMTSYMVTEAQVFAPERTEFDEIINRTILSAMGIKDWRFVSIPITLKNVDIQMKALELATGKIEGENFIEELNAVSGLNLEYSEEAEEKAMAMANPMMGEEGEEGEDKEPMVNNDKKPKDVEPKTVKKVQTDPTEIVQLVSKWAQVMGLTPKDIPIPHDEREAVLKRVHELNEEEQDVFNNVLSIKSFVNTSTDPEGLKSIAQCCAKLMED